MPAFNASDLIGGSGGNTFNFQDLGEVATKVARPLVTLSDRSLNGLGGTPLGAGIRFAGDVAFNQMHGRNQDLLGSVVRSAHPALAIVDVFSEALGGPSVKDGFTSGVNLTGKPRIPPLPY